MKFNLYSEATCTATPISSFVQCQISFQLECALDGISGVFALNLTGNLHLVIFAWNYFWVNLKNKSWMAFWMILYLYHLTCLKEWLADAEHCYKASGQRFLCGCLVSLHMQIYYTERTQILFLWFQKNSSSR